MYIKSIVINDFKAYSGREVIDELDPGLNVIVGRNGSGKTTLFNAILFVLSEKFKRLDQKERQKLCNYRKQSGPFSLYVEVKFDNSDRALPFDVDEVCLKRDLTPKKDQFSINGKICTKEEVKQNFHVCGFYTHEASFNIVKQGMVNSLAVANDAKRLNMIKELSGVEQYEEKLKATKEVLLDINNEIKEDKQLIKNLERQLKKLDIDKQKLTEYQELEADRKCVHYILLEQNLENTKNKLENLLAAHEETILHSEELLSKLNECNKQVQEAENNLAAFNEKLDGFKEKLQTLSTERGKLIEERADVELQIKNLTEQRTASKDLKNLTRKIVETTEKLAKMNSKYNELKSNESKLCQEIALIEQKCQALRSKHLKQFNSKEERDSYINNKLKQIETDCQVENERLKQLFDDRAKTKKELDKLKQLKQRAAKQEENRKLVFDCEKEKMKSLNELKELQRVERELKSKIAVFNDKINKKHYTIMNTETLKGIESVKRVLQSFGDRETRLLIDIIDCNSDTLDKLYRLYKVIDIIAKKRLFHHVVSTEEFALKLLNEINRYKLPGEIVFLPLDKLNVQTVTYPKTSDAEPLVKKLIYDEKFDPVIQYVFNRALICRNLNVAKNLIGTSKLDCITMAGDQVFGNGLVSGGYYKESKSRIEVYKEIAQMAAQKSALANELVKTEDNIRECNKRILQNKQKTAELDTDVDPLQPDCIPKEIELKEMEKRLAEYEKTILQVQLTLNKLRVAEESLKNELDQDMDEDTSVTDELENLDMEKQRLSEREKKVFKDCAILQTEIEKTENQLQNLTDRKEEIVKYRERFGENEEVLEKRLDDIEERLQEIEVLSNEIQKTMDETIPQKRDVMEILEKWQETQKKTKQEISRNKSFQHFAEKKIVFEKQIAEIEKELDQLLMPRMELYEEYNSMSMNELEEAAKKLKKKLGKFSNINLIVVEQFTKLSEQRDKCVEKIEAAKQSVKSLKRLMKNGQNKFNEHLEPIIKDIDRQFRKIFEKLIPSGKAKLVVKRKVVDEENDDDSDGTFEGIGIEVFFPGNDEGTKEIAQLSSGQKTLVALTLIFAIQKWQATMTGKPVPVYLFDEFDQNLDPQHRESVAEMIRDMSLEAQIIIITFRPELLEHAAQLYQVRYANGVSHINPLNRQEAANLVQSDDPSV